ncbi:type II toxin-antitoxin system RelE/ParE family toxin [Candidatus Woesearchaeota archaeon]|nr:type II toxin-antitoxin system RelE/ParE family toxin [Candidatus Woesearchaeota archaeon]
MIWKVSLSPDVQHFLERQDHQIAARIRKGLEKLKTENPFHYLEHFEGQDFYKYRISDYRALIDIDFTNKILKVQVVDHRSLIYKRIKNTPSQPRFL